MRSVSLHKITYIVRYAYMYMIKLIEVNVHVVIPAEKFWNFQRDITT